MVREQKLLRKYPNPIHWNVPFLLNNDRVARDLLNTCKIVSGVQLFDNIYGGFRCFWSGGRGSIVEGVVDYIPGVKEFNELGVFTWLTFSRYNMDECKLNDSRMWKIVEWLSHYRCGVIVSSNSLLHKLKEFNPSIPVKASVVKCTREILPVVLSEDYSVEEELLYYLNLFEEGYDSVVVRPEFIINGGGRLIPDYLRDCVEIMVNQFCTYNCPKAVYHYDLIEKFEETGKWDGFQCSSRGSYLDCINNVVIDYDTVVELSRLGYSHFKIQGRGLSPRCAIDQIAKYICEPTGLIHIIGEQIIQNIERERAQGLTNRF